MPPTQLTPETWIRLFRRALVYGPPNSWKTTSLLTWPRPLHVVMFPGELGGATITPSEDVHVYVWEHDLSSKQASSAQIVREVKALVSEILAGKRGPVGTFAGEGLHKLYQLMWDANAEGVEDLEKLRGMIYGITGKEFKDFVKGINSSTVGHAVFTCWAEREKDDPDNTSQRAPSHIFPALPGQLSQLILGEFGATLYAEPGQEVAPGKFTPGRWQTRRAGKVWGAGLKVPAAIAAKIPTFVPQDWDALERLVLTKEAA